MDRDTTDWPSISHVMMHSTNQFMVGHMDQTGTIQHSQASAKSAKYRTNQRMIQNMTCTKSMHGAEIIQHELACDARLMQHETEHRSTTNSHDAANNQNGRSGRRRVTKTPRLEPSRAPIRLSPQSFNHRGIQRSHKSQATRDRAWGIQTSLDKGNRMSRKG
ncbi:Glyco_transf_20 domain-containing protein [Psidium guajava]|nr:Glyco_transf_20 domain-containing protein [Psidium guajava]